MPDTKSGQVAGREGIIYNLDGSKRKKMGRRPKDAKKLGRPRKEIEGFREPVLIEASKALSTSIDGIGSVPHRLSPTKETAFKFENCHSILKTLVTSGNNLYLMGGDQPFTDGEDTHHVPVIVVLMTPKGTEPPSLLRHCKSNMLSTFEEKEYEWCPLKRLVRPDYSGKRKGSAHPLVQLDEFLGQKVFALKFKGRSRNYKEEHNVEFTDLRLLDCRSAGEGAIPARFFNPDGTMDRAQPSQIKSALAFFQCDGESHCELCDRNTMTKEDFVNKMIHDFGIREDSANRTLIRNAWEVAFQAKSDSINTGLSALEAYDQSLVDDIKLALILPSNLPDAFKLTANLPYGPPVSINGNVIETTVIDNDSDSELDSDSDSD